MNLSSFSLKVLTASLVLVSTTGLAFAKNYKAEANYKGEPVYKGEVPCPVPPMLRDGFYIGAQAGYDSYRVRETIGDVDPADTETVGNPVIASNGWVGGLYLGYGRYLTDMFYLAGEIYGNVSGAEQSWNIWEFDAVESEIENYTNKIETNGSWGIALIPGVRLNDASLGYVRLGYNWVNLKSTETFTETPVPTAPGTSVSTSKSNTSNGFNFGLGIETLLWDNWSIRTEYNHIYLNSFNSAIGTKFNPSDNQFLVGVSYHFA